MKDIVADQIAEIMRRLQAPADRVNLVKTGNDVYHIVSDGDSFFLKTYTKNWYGSDPGAAGYNANHEAAAWGILARHNLAAPQVVSVATSTASSAPTSAKLFQCFTVSSSYGIGKEPIGSPAELPIYHHSASLLDFERSQDSDFGLIGRSVSPWASASWLGSG